MEHFRVASSKSGKIYLHTDVRMIIFRKSDLDTATDHESGKGWELRCVINLIVFINIFYHHIFLGLSLADPQIRSSLLENDCGATQISTTIYYLNIGLLD